MSQVQPQRQLVPQGQPAQPALSQAQLAWEALQDLQELRALQALQELLELRLLDPRGYLSPDRLEAAQQV